MEEILNQIECALKNNFYYIALQSTLTLPDICAALESSDGTATKKKYINWYSNNVNANNGLDAENCYFFRCSILHQATTQHKNSTFNRIIFLEPSNSKNIVLSNVQFNNMRNNGEKVLTIDLMTFCKRIIDSVRQWLVKVVNDPNFIKNYDKMIKIYPNGLPPYIVGIPVIG